MICHLCGEYECSEEAHDASLTHTFNSLKYFLSQRSNKKNLRVEEQVKIEEQINLFETRMTNYADNKMYDCGGLEDGFCEESFETLEECLEHEKTCLKFTRDREVVKKQKKLFSNQKAICDKCGKVYLHTTKLLPKYALNRHQKNCKGLSLDKQILNHLKCLDNDKQKQVLDFIKTL